MHGEASTVTSDLWEIYQDIGRSNAGDDLTDAQKAKLVEDLRSVANKLEAQLPVYN
jgi:hypothetical protein